MRLAEWMWRTIRVSTSVPSRWSCPVLKIATSGHPAMAFPSLNWWSHLSCLHILVEREHPFWRIVNTDSDGSWTLILVWTWTLLGFHQNSVHDPRIRDCDHRILPTYWISTAIVLRFLYGADMPTKRIPIVCFPKIIWFPDCRRFVFSEKSLLFTQIVWKLKTASRVVVTIRYPARENGWKQGMHWIRRRDRFTTWI